MQSIINSKKMFLALGLLLGLAIGFTAHGIMQPEAQAYTPCPSPPSPYLITQTRTSVPNSSGVCDYVEYYKLSSAVRDNYYLYKVLLNQSDQTVTVVMRKNGE